MSHHLKQWINMNSRLPKSFKAQYFTSAREKNLPPLSWLSIAAEVTLLRYAVRTSSETSLAFQQENSSPWSCSFWIIPREKGPARRIWVRESRKITFDYSVTTVQRSPKTQKNNHSQNVSHMYIYIYVYYMSVLIEFFQLVDENHFWGWSNHQK